MPQPAAAPRAQRALNSVTPGQFLAEHIVLISKLKKAQLASLTDDDRKYATKPFWFCYFWEECEANPSGFRPHAALIASFFERMYVLPPTWDPGNAACELEFNGNDLAYVRRLRAGGATPIGQLTLKPNAWGQVPDQDLRNVLEALLSIGFEAVTPTGSDRAPFGKSQFTDFPRASDIDVRRQSLVGELDKAYFLGWRGDGRDLKKIQAAGGLINKAQSDYQGYATSQNMREAWHPFSDPAKQPNWYFRKAKEDNCLQTVVSVSTDFKTASTFPLLNADYVILPPVAPKENELSRLDHTEQRKWYRITGTSQGRQKTVIRFADRQQLYLVIVDTQYFDTQKKQTYKFPEIAVKKIPDTGVFACISFVRVHHVTVDMGGMTALYDASRSFPPTLDACRRYCQSQKFAKVLFTHVERVYNETIAVLSQSYHVKWGSTGAVTVPPFADDDGHSMTIATVKGVLSGSLYP
jgi:hypothetical protein